MVTRAQSVKNPSEGSDRSGTNFQQQQLNSFNKEAPKLHSYYYNQDI